MFPKPAKGSGALRRRLRKKRLDKYRDLVNAFCLEADKYLCALCGQPACHAHHCYGRGRAIESWRENPDHRLSLCDDCHRGHHDRWEPNKEEMIAALEMARKKRMLDFEEWMKKNHDTK